MISKKVEVLIFYFVVYFLKIFFPQTLRLVIFQTKFQPEMDLNQLNIR